MSNLEPGSVIGRHYRIETTIGRGGLGTVYRALDLRLNRFVALKVLPSQLANDPEFIRRFQQEALTWSRMDHPNILRIYDYTISAGITYIATEYVDGGSLADRLAGTIGPLDPEFVLAIIVQIGAALSYAHAQGIVHLDVKPSNILIGKDGRVLLSDFGLAQAISRLTSSSLSSVGTILGTPVYMSPEQAMGNPLDARSDIYSLGVVLYQLLTGTVPFQGESLTATLYDQVHKPPPRLRASNPSIPSHLEEVILQSLAKDPAQRCQSMEGFVQTLRSAFASYQLSSQSFTDVPPRATAEPPQYHGLTPMIPMPPRRAGPYPWIWIAWAALLVGMVGLILRGRHAAVSGEIISVVLLLTAVIFLAGLVVGLIQLRERASREKAARVTPPASAAPAPQAPAGSSREPIVKPPREMSTDETLPLRQAEADRTMILQRASDVAAFFLVLNGPQRGRQLTFKGTLATIGRGPSNTINLDDPAVSRHHAKIRLERDRFYIYDLASSNETFVNGVRVMRMREELRDRDEIRVGDTNLIFMQLATDISPDARRRLQEFDTVWDDLARAAYHE